MDVKPLETDELAHVIGRAYPMERVEAPDNMQRLIERLSARERGRIAQPERA